MPHYVIDKLQNALNQRKKPLFGSRVLIMGLAYKKDIDDPRESPSFELMHLLHKHGAVVDYHDPHIPEMPAMRSWPDLDKRASVTLSAESVAAYDAVLISTNHTAVDYDLVLQNSQLVVDTRGVYRTPHERVIKA